MIKEHNTLNMKALGDITKHILQHAVINCKEPKVPHKQCKNTLNQKGANDYEICHKEYEVFKPTQSKQYPQDRSNTHDNHKQFKQIAQPSKHNHFESTKNTHKVQYSKPKKIIT